MDVGDESLCEKAVPSVSRTRCNTWHAGLEDDDDGSPVPTDPSFLLAVRGGAGVKRSTRRNAWGTASYADLIAAAIDSSPDKRLTLSQIYDWMVMNVQYFGDRADSSSSAGWKNSIRHNLSLHRRFVRVPHHDGKGSWWTVSSSEPSNLRWPRGHNSTRHRANSIDTRSYVLQRQRRGKKFVPNSSTDSIQKSNTRTVPLPFCGFKSVEEAKAGGMKLFGGEDFYTSCLDNAVFLSTCSTSSSLCNMDTTPVTSVFSTVRSSCSPTLTAAFACSGGQTENTQGDSSSFDSKCSGNCESSFAVSVLNDDEYSNVMITQLSTRAWSQLETVATDLAAGGPGAVVVDSHHLPLFSDDSMLSASQLTDSSQDDLALCDDQELMLAAYSTIASPSDLPSFRRGSDAPPPSPESSCGEPSFSFDETVSNLAEMKVETTATSTNSTEFTNWTSVLPLKTDDLSSLSDMDMEH